MKLNIVLLFLVSVSLFTTGCSNDDNSSDNSNQIYQDLLGKWYFENPTTNPTHNNSFTFKSNGNVTYSYWDGSPGNNYDSEIGTFSVSANVLTMVFPETVSLTFIQKVVFITPDKIEFQPTGVTGEEAYEGDYFREGSTLQDTSFKIEVGGILKTNMCDITTNSYSVQLEYISDGSTNNTQNFNGSTQQNLSNNFTLAGNIIGVKIKLLNFNSTNATNGRGTGLADLTFKITGVQTNNTIYNNVNLSDLFICTDAAYEALLLYNKSAGAFTQTYQTHGF
jgi:hypothetical protein